MTRRLASLTLDNLDDLAGRCRDCVFWELDAIGSERAATAGSGAAEKRAWLSNTLLEWGSCGQVLHVDDVAVGHALYAPPAYVPRTAAFPTSPIGPDAIALMAVRLEPEFTGAGLGRMLMQGVARDLVRRGIKAIEAFGRTGADGPAGGCLLPAEFLVAVGFQTVRGHPRTPRLRLELRSLLTWREDVEQALERLRGSLQVPGLARSQAEAGMRMTPVGGSSAIGR